MERQRKRELRTANAKAWAGEKGVFPVQGSLDSAMKKNTAFIRRLRTAITATSKDIFLQEIRSLSLHRYLSEIISACFEGLCKLKTPAEIGAGVEIVSALHQRFGPEEFTEKIGWLMGKGLSTPDKAYLKTLPHDQREREERDRIARQRVLLRVATELWLAGILKSLDDTSRPEEVGLKGKDGAKATEAPAKARPVRGEADAEPFPLEALKDMLGYDREHVNLPLVVIFVKAFSWDILGVHLLSSDERRNITEDTTATKTDDDGAGDNNVAGSDTPLISSELQVRFRNILSRYFEDVKSHILRDQRSLVTQERKNAEAYVKSGEVFEDRQANYEKQAKSQEKLIANAQVLAEALKLEMPDLHEKDSTAAVGDGLIGLVKAGEYLRGASEGAGIWEDEEERRFYENVIDLKDRVPGILLEEGRKKKPESEDQVGKRLETDVADEKAAEAAHEKNSEQDDQSTAIANKSVGAQVDTLLARLPELSTKDQVDQAAQDFCFLNSKASRNRLIKTVQELPRGRTDLLPLYSRLVATLGKYMSDISQGLVTYLDDEFRSLQRRKSKDFLGQVRTQNVRYLAELTKFGIVREHVIFHCLKVSLDDFSRMNIEIISNLLENCGRYLLRNPETAPRMSSFLETLQRKKGAQHLGPQERMLLENAIYYVNPPERAAIEQKERTPLDLFLRKLVYSDLSKKTVDKITRQLRKLHWEEEEVVRSLEKVFTKPHRVKYINIQPLACMLGELDRYHHGFVVDVVDDIVEQVTLGLEINDFKYNQRRLVQVRYLGELYCYKIVEAPLIFDTLYQIICYGHEGRTPRPGAYSFLDTPDDFFRVRLVCELLETCCGYFSSGQNKKKLDFFLTFFQYYIQTKEPTPMDIEFVIQDAFALVRPQWKIITNLEESSKAFADAVKTNYQVAGGDKAADVEEPEAESSSDDNADDDDRMIGDGEDEKSSGEEAGDSHEDEGHDASSSEEEQIIVTRPEDQRDPEADAEFDREFAKMMSESMETRKFERKPVFDVPLPMKRAREGVSEAVDVQSDQVVPAPSEPGVMKFSLLSKRGNRQQTRSIDLPSDSNFAVAMRSHQQEKKEEQQRIKNLVLKYDLQDEPEADGEYDSPLLQPNPNRPTRKTNAETSIAADRPYSFTQPRGDRPGGGRNAPRARRLQISDVDWSVKSPSRNDSPVEGCDAVPEWNNHHSGDKVGTDADFPVLPTKTAARSKSDSYSPLSYAQAARNKSSWRGNPQRNG